MAIISLTPRALPLRNTECSGEENLDSVSTDSFVLQAQEKEKADGPHAYSRLSLHLSSKAKPASSLKAKTAVNSFLPWKLLQPKRGISKMIFMVVASTEKRTGISLQGIKKIIAATGYNLEKRKKNFKRVLRALLAKGLLMKLTGQGLTGSYAVSSMMLKVLRRRKKKRRRRRRNVALRIKKKSVSRSTVGKKRRRTGKTQPDTACSQKPQEI